MTPLPPPRGSWRARLIAVSLVAAGIAWSCGRSPASPSSGGGTPPPDPIPDTGIGVLVGAGDIAVCDPTISAGTVATARQLDGLSGTVFTAGDNAYFQGSLDQFQKCYDPLWGRFKSRTKPVPGNHDYETPGAAGYFAYFGDQWRGPNGEGYYSYTIGPWLILALNSEVPATANSAQAQWIRSEVAARGNPPCTMAIWHRPLFTSGPNRDNPDMRDLWRVLYELKADVIVNGHDHLYERFALQDPDGRPDPANGIQQFTVGTGGATLYNSVMAHSNSEVRTTGFGVIEFTLFAGGYSWHFMPADATASPDTGTGHCH